MTNEEAIDVLEHNFPSSCYTDLCEAVNVAIEALQRETSDDAISRQAAIEGLKGYIDDTGIFNQDKWFVHGIKTAITHLKSLPSVQPEPCKSIENILEYLDDVLHPIVSPDNWNVYSELYDMISDLPSAQPEPLTDKEQRIFLAAMGREEKVCEEVDRKYTREPYEDSLMWICREIKRKVKGALWTQ